MGSRGAGCGTTNVSWAYLQDLASGGVFMALSMHLPNEKTTGRAATAAGNRAWRPGSTPGNVELGLGAIPIVAMGDLNSFQKRQPQGARRSSTISVSSTPPSAIAHQRQVPDRQLHPFDPPVAGVPINPSKYADGQPDRLRPGQERVRPLTHEVFLKLRNGRFDKRFRGSDHNLVRATLSVPVVLR